MFPHFHRHVAGMRRPEEKMPHVQSAEQAGRCTGDKDKQEGEGQLPSQGVIHCWNSVWMALSAIAYSFVCGVERAS